MTTADVVKGLPFDKYVLLPGIHATTLKSVLVSPRAYRAALLKPRKDRDTLRLGRAGHTAALEPDRFLLEYAVFTAKDDDGNHRIRRGKVWDAFCEANKDKTILTVPQYETALSVRDAVREHEVAATLLDSGESEVTIKWTHAGTGLACVSRLDWLGDALVDVKLTRDPTQVAFGRDASKYGYVFQLAMYREACRAAGVADRPVKIIAAQNCEPFDVVVHDVSTEQLDYGLERFELAMLRVQQCAAAKAWPGAAPLESVPLLLPPWDSPSAEDEPLTMDGAAIF